MKCKCRTTVGGIEKDISWGDIVIPIIYQNIRKFREGVSGLFMGGCTPDIIEKAGQEDRNLIGLDRSRLSHITGWLKAMDEIYANDDAVTVTMVYGHLTRDFGSSDTFGMVIPLDTRVLVRNTEQTFNTLANFYRVRQMISMVTQDELQRLDKEYNIKKCINAEVDRVNKSIVDSSMLGCGVYFGPLIQEYNGPVKSKQDIKLDIKNIVSKVTSDQLNDLNKKPDVSPYI